MQTAYSFLIHQILCQETTSSRLSIALLLKAVQPKGRSSVQLSKTVWAVQNIQAYLPYQALLALQESQGSVTKNCIHWDFSHIKMLKHCVKNPCIGRKMSKHRFSLFLRWILSSEVILWRIIGKYKLLNGFSYCCSFQFHSACSETIYKVRLSSMERHKIMIPVS